MCVCLSEHCILVRAFCRGSVAKASSREVDLGGVLEIVEIGLGISRSNNSELMDRVDGMLRSTASTKAVK